MGKVTGPHEDVGGAGGYLAVLEIIIDSNRKD